MTNRIEEKRRKKLKECKVDIEFSFFECFSFLFRQINRSHKQYDHCKIQKKQKINEKRKAACTFFLQDCFFLCICVCISRAFIIIIIIFVRKRDVFSINLQISSLNHRKMCRKSLYTFFTAFMSWDETIKKSNAFLKPFSINVCIRC